MPKLKTMLYDGQLIRTDESFYKGMEPVEAYHDDALTAHQQREVIRQLVEALYPVACNCPEHVAKREALRAAAQPFLD